MKYKYWVARDKNGKLCLYETKPERDYDVKTWQSGRFCQMPKHLFPDLTWEDEPIEVEIRPTITDLDAKAKEYADKVTDNEELREMIVNAFKAGHDA